MKIGKSVLSLVLLAGLGLNLNAQEQVEGFVHEHSATSDYVWPTDPQVLEKLDKWQDLKFGVLFHWGALFCARNCGVLVYLFGRRGLDFTEKESAL